MSEKYIDFIKHSYLDRVHGDRKTPHATDQDVGDRRQKVQTKNTKKPDKSHDMITHRDKRHRDLI